MSVRDLYAQYSARVQFLVIYIREAHPTDGWALEKNAVTFADPRTMEERRKVAGECEAALEYGIRTLVDEMHDPVMTAYAAWPERIYLVDAEGAVAYAGGPGPAGFKPSELKEAIEGLPAAAPERETGS